MDKETHLIAESVQINAISAEELCHEFDEGECQEETGQKSIEQSAVSQEQSMTYQVSECREDTEYDAVTPAENLYNFEKSEGPSLPAQSLHHEQQEIVPYLRNHRCSVQPKLEFIFKGLIGHQRSSLRPRRILPRITLPIPHQDCTDTEDMVRLLGKTVHMSNDESVEDEDFTGQILTGLQLLRILRIHSRLQCITDQDSIQTTECETTNRTQLERLHTPSNQQIKKHLESEGGGIERSTSFGLLDFDEEMGQYYEDPSRNTFGKPWKGTIIHYYNDDYEDEVGALLDAQGFEAEPSTPKGRKGTAKGKHVSLKEQRRLKSTTKKAVSSKNQWTGYKQNKGSYDAAGRKEARNQYNSCRGMSLSPYHYSSVSPDVTLSPRHCAPVPSLPSLTQIFDDYYSRTSQSTRDHREKIRARARKVYHKRCLNRERAYLEGDGERTSADKMEEGRDSVKPEHKADLMKEVKEAHTFKRLKQNKGDKFKVAGSELLPSDITEHKTKINKIKKTGKISKDKRKEKRKANKEESTKLALEIYVQKDIEEVTDDSNFSDKSPEENGQSVEVIEQDDLEAQNKIKHCENINRDDSNDSERKMGNITTESVTEKNTIGDGHFEEMHSKNSQVEKIRDQFKFCENVEKKNVKHQRVNHFPSKTPSVVPKCYDSATEIQKHNHTNQGALHHVICKTSQESYCRETGNYPDTDPVDRVPYATYHSQFRRQNGGTRLPKGRVSAADRRTRSADWENLQQGKQNEANWRWREDSAAAGDWACQNKAELRPTESQRSRRNHSRDQGDSDQNECRPYEGISLRLHRDRHRVTGDGSVSNRGAERQRNRQRRKPSRKERLRGHLPSCSSLSRNWRSKKGSWEANNAVCESDRLCDPAVLVSPPKPEPHIRNRRLSPGSGIGGGGGGGCSAGPDKQQLRQASPSALEATLNGTGQPFTFTHSRERERRGHTRGRGPRRESLRVGGRPGSDKAQRPGPVQKARWVEDSLSLLKPPPAFPVKDSPAKLQPAVSYASKVKAGGGASGGTEEPPGIGVLLQNQWGLSFISDGPAENSPSAAAAPDLAQIPTPQATPETAAIHPAPPSSRPLTGDMDSEKPALAATPPAPATSYFSLELCNRQDESSGELLLTCRHLVEAMQYHVQEWNTVYNRQKEDPEKVVWYKNSLEQPA